MKDIELHEIRRIVMLTRVNILPPILYMQKLFPPTSCTDQNNFNSLTLKGLKSEKKSPALTTLSD